MLEADSGRAFFLLKKEGGHATTTTLANFLKMRWRRMSSLFTCMTMIMNKRVSFLHHIFLHPARPPAHDHFFHDLFVVLLLHHDHHHHHLALNSDHIDFLGVFHH